MKNGDNSNPRKSPRAGRVVGIILVILGSILTGVLVYLVSTAQSLPRLLIAGPAIMGLGLGMFIFPGGDFTCKDMQNTKKGARRLWSEAPNLHKAVWIVMGLIGLVISFKIMISQKFLAPL